MDSDSKDRRDLGRIVSHYLRHPELREHFPVVNDAGIRPIITAMPSDTLATIFAAVERHGGEANVISPGDDGFHVVTFHKSPKDADTEEHCPLHPESEFGLLLEYLQTQGTLRCRLAMPNFEMELLPEPLHA